MAIVEGPSRPLKEERGEGNHRGPLQLASAPSLPPALPSRTWAIKIVVRGIFSWHNRLHLQAPRQASALGPLRKAFEEVSLIPPSPRDLEAPLGEYPRWS